MPFFQNFSTKQPFAWGHHSVNQAACRLAGPGNRPSRQVVCPQGETAEWSRMWMCPRNLTGSTLSTIQKRAIGNDICLRSQFMTNSPQTDLEIFLGWRLLSSSWPLDQRVAAHGVHRNVFPWMKSMNYIVFKIKIIQPLPSCQDWRASWWVVHW